MSGPAIEAAISGEDACIYAYGVIGSQVRGPAKARARKALVDHRAWRDRMQAQSPGIVAASIAYDFPFPVEDPASAKQLAVLVENRMVGLYADLAASVSGQAREDAVTAAMECATRAIAWGGLPQAFPQG
jgi:hypothetical protein